jgi:predicted transcriptional regulator
MVKDMSNSFEFLSIYDELDEYMRRYLKADDNIPHRTLIERIAKKNNLLSKYREDLIDFAKLRNAIIHNPYRAMADPIAEPHENIVELYRNIRNKIINPSVALDISVKIKNIYCASPEDNAMQVMKIMSEQTFSHVPILINNRVIGVFSQYTVFSYLVKNQSICLDSTMKVKDYAEYTPLESHGGEYYEFVSKNTLASETEQMFKRRKDNHKRLGIVFVTENGSQDEKLLGIITGLDIARYSD